MHLILLPDGKATIMLRGDITRNGDSFVKHLYFEGSALNILSRRRWIKHGQFNSSIYLCIQMDCNTAVF